MTQPAFHVAEGVQVGDELDAAGGARVVQFPHLLRRERGGVAPRVLVSREGERVLHVELELVGAQRVEALRQRDQLLLPRDAQA